MRIGAITPRLFVMSVEMLMVATSFLLSLQWIEAENLEKATLESSPVKYHEAWSKLCCASGILVPGGFGNRGVDGKVAAARWARENKIPYLGICLGMQVCDGDMLAVFNVHGRP